MGKFIKVKCKCGEEKKVFSHSTKKILCACGELILQPTGGAAVIVAQILEE
ncbi:MAG: 30S ribosomal protein S27e [Candidatus Micrarchaeia archaeon]|jgi:ribosomal protein S27E